MNPRGWRETKDFLPHLSERRNGLLEILLLNRVSMFDDSRKTIKVFNGLLRISPRLKLPPIERAEIPIEISQESRGIFEFSRELRISRSSSFLVFSKNRALRRDRPPTDINPHHRLRSSASLPVWKLIPPFPPPPRTDVLLGIWTTLRNGGTGRTRFEVSSPRPPVGSPKIRRHSARPVS